MAYNTYIENLLRASRHGYGGSMRPDPGVIAAELLAQGAYGLQKKKAKKSEERADTALEERIKAADRSYELAKERLATSAEQFEKRFGLAERQFDWDKTQQGFSAGLGTPRELEEITGLSYPGRQRGRRMNWVPGGGFMSTGPTKGGPLSASYLRGGGGGVNPAVHGRNVYSGGIRGRQSIAPQLPAARTPGQRFGRRPFEQPLTADEWGMMPG